MSGLIYIYFLLINVLSVVQIVVYVKIKLRCINMNVQVFMLEEYVKCSDNDQLQLMNFLSRTIGVHLISCVAYIN